MQEMLWMRKGFGFSGPWTVIEQNRMLGLCFGHGSCAGLVEYSYNGGISALQADPQPRQPEATL